MHNDQHAKANLHIHRSCSAVENIIEEYLNNDVESIGLVKFLRKKLVTLNHRILLKENPTEDNNSIFHCGDNFLTEDEKRSVNENFYRKHGYWYGLPPPYAAEFEKKVKEGFL